ncbi:MAG: DUF2520 domain-containing protein [Acidimicrobiales bacterium]
MSAFRIIGPGRAGRSLAGALIDAGWELTSVLGRTDDVRRAAHGVDLLVIATPDGQIASVAAAVEPSATTVVAHLSGALGLEVLSTHPRRGALHPLVPLPSAEVGRVRLRSGVTFAVAGDPLVRQVTHALGGRVIEVDDDRRAEYHAAACIASNHVVAVLGQARRVAHSAGLSLDDFLGLTRAALTDVAELGPAAALTGPAARGDEATLERHRAVLAGDELAAYDAGVALAKRLSAERGAELEADFSMGATR